MSGMIINATTSGNIRAMYVMIEHVAAEVAVVVVGMSSSAVRAKRIGDIMNSTNKIMRA